MNAFRIGGTRTHRSRCGRASMRFWAIWMLFGLADLDAAQAERCGENLMYCPASGACLPTRLMCDGKRDCPSGEDESERYCNSSCPLSNLACSFKVCIPYSQVCESSGYRDCPNDRDEEAALCDRATNTPIWTTISITTTGDRATTTQIWTTMSITTIALPGRNYSTEPVSAPTEAYCISTLVNVSSQLAATLPRVINQTVVELMCITTGQPLLTATCMLTGQDKEIGGYVVVISNVSCPYNVSASTPRLGDLTLEPITESSILNIAMETRNLTSSPAILQPADISYASQILLNLAEFYGSSIASAKLLMQVSPLVATVISNIMDVDKEVLQDARKDNMLVTRLIGSFDAMLLKTAEALAFGNQFLGTTDETPLVITKNLAYQVTAGPKLAGLALCMLANGTSTPTAVMNELTCADCSYCSGTRLAAITLSQQALKLPRTYAVYSSSSLFGDGAAPGASVLASQINEELPRPDSLTGSGLVTVRQKINQTAVIKGFELTCGYWNFSKNDWDTMGCITVIEPSSGDVVCTCNHLTNFAVLMVPGGTAGGGLHDMVLSYLSIIFLSISCFALLFVLITFFVYRKLRSSDAQRLTACLSTSLLCMNLLFIFGIDATDDEDSCAALAVMLHYFLLTSFMFMTAEAILHYLRLVKVLGAHVSHFIWKVSAVSLGVPAVTVIAIRFGDPSLYGKGGQYCWVQPSLQIYGVIVPIAVVVVINSVVFGLIVRALKCRPQLSSSMSDRKLASLHAKALAAIFVVLGITWVFGFLATIEDASVAFQYLFSICNSLQGVLIFVFHNMKAPFIARSFKSTLIGARSTAATSQTDADKRRISALSLSTNVSCEAYNRHPASGTGVAV